jgi:pSer/pThr/pTyr-binding forkhead associated (FHA) protein
MLTFLNDADPYLAICPVINCGVLANIEENNLIENSMYVTVGDTNRAKVGRLFDNGVILEDPSVSRQHAEIELINNTTFLIRDYKSKYGTLIYDPEA